LALQIVAIFCLGPKGMRIADCGCCKLSGWWMWVWPCGNRVTLNYALTRTQNTRSQDQGLCAVGDTVSITVWLATGLKNK